MKMPFFSSPNMPVSIKAILLSGTAALTTTGVAAGLGAGVAAGLGMGVAAGLGTGVAAGLGMGVAAGLGVGVGVGFDVVVNGLVWALTEILITATSVNVAKIKRCMFIAFPLSDDARGLSQQITQIVPRRKKRKGGMFVERVSGERLSTASDSLSKPSLPI